MVVVHIIGVSFSQVNYLGQAVRSNRKCRYTENAVIHQTGQPVVGSVGGRTPLLHNVVMDAKTAGTVTSVPGQTVWTVLNINSCDVS